MEQERYVTEKYILIIENSPSPEACESLLRILASIPKNELEYERRVVTTERGESANEP